MDRFIIYIIRDFLFGSPTQNYSRVLKDLNLQSDRDEAVVLNRDLGDEYMLNNNNTLCEKHFQLAISRNDRYSRFRLGLYYEDQGNIKESIKHLKLAANLGDPWALYDLVRIFTSHKDLEKASYYRSYIR